MVKINFEFDTQYGKFSDALWFPDSQIPDDATVEAMKQERLNNWIAAVTTPPPAEPPAPEV